MYAAYQLPINVCWASSKVILCVMHACRA